MWRWLVFAAGSILIVWVSSGSLKRHDTHGFYRFFAFESILGLVTLNATEWFLHPFSLRQLASWILLLASLLLAAHGFYLLRHLGVPNSNIEDPTRLGIEKTTRLVREGAYRWIRHPLYTSLLALAWGAFLKGPTWLSALLATVATGAVFLTARVEERENLRNFGEEYAAYMRETRMFVPFII